MRGSEYRQANSIRSGRNAKVAIKEGRIIRLTLPLSKEEFLREIFANVNTNTASEAS